MSGRASRASWLWRPTNVRLSTTTRGPLPLDGGLDRRPDGEVERLVSEGVGVHLRPVEPGAERVGSAKSEYRGSNCLVESSKSR